MIINLNKDMFTTDASVFIHQANCHCTMGSGVAAIIKKLYVEAWQADANTLRGDKFKLGSFTFADCQNGKRVYNMYAQYYYGTEVRQTDYEAFYKGLSAIKTHIELTGSPSIAIPYKIGSDRGGADWRIIERMIEVVFESYNGYLYVCNYTP